MATCYIRPQIKKANGESVDSILFTDLMRHFKNREKAMYIYSMSLIDDFKKSISNMSDIEYDENGEITIDSLSKILKLNVPNEDFIKSQENKKRTNKDGSLKLTQDGLLNQKFVNDAVLYNLSNGDSSVKIESENGKIYMSEDSKENGFNNAKDIFEGNEMCRQMLSFMKSMGLSYGFIDSINANGLFDPTNHELTEYGLRKVILISNGELGVEAFPEEFCHMILAGLSNNTNVANLIESISDSDIKSILGDMYDRYYEEYKGDKRLLRLEAAGQLLNSFLKNQYNNSHIETKVKNQRNLLQRVFDAIKAFFKKFSTDSILECRTKTEEGFKELARKISKDLNMNNSDPETMEILNEFTVKAFDDYNKKLFALKEGKLKVMQENPKSIKDIAEKLLIAERQTLSEYSSKSITNDYYKNLLDGYKKTIFFMADSYNKTNYVSDINEFLASVNDRIRQFNDSKKSIEEQLKAGYNSEGVRKYVFHMLSDMNEYINGYYSHLDAIVMLATENKDSMKGLINDKDIEDMASRAYEMKRQFDEMKIFYKRYSKIAVCNFLAPFYRIDKYKDNPLEAYNQMCIIFDKVQIDTNFINANFASMHGSNNEILSLVDRVVKEQIALRDSDAYDENRKIQKIHREYYEATGSKDTSFMFNFDSEGNKTNYLKSEYNWVEYKKKRRELIKKLRQMVEDKKLSNKQKDQMIKEWEDENTETYSYIDSVSKIERKFIVPKKSIYPSNALSTLNSAQRKYYDEMMKIKMFYHANQSGSQNPWYAIPIRESNAQMIARVKNPVEIMKNFVSEFTKSVNARDVRYDEEEDFDEEDEDGEYIDGKYKKVRLGIDGNPIKSVPKMFARGLKDPNELSDDFTSAMVAFTGACINYKAMSDIADQMQMVQTVVDDMKFQKFYGDSKLVDVMRNMGMDIAKQYVIDGSKTNVSKQLKNYLNTVLYGEGKKMGELGTIPIPLTEKQKKDKNGKPMVDEDGNPIMTNVEIDTSKLIDGIKRLSGLSGMGFNVYSAISNVTMGKMQQYIEAAAGQFFGVKDYLWSQKEYFKLMPKYLTEIASNEKNSKFGMLIEVLDPMEDWFESQKQQGGYKGWLANIAGKSSAYILQNLGEHVLHTTTMLSMLHHYKVKINGKESTLYDAIQIESFDGIKYLTLKEGITDVNGKLLYDEMDPSSRMLNHNEFIKNYNMKIKYCNQTMNGAYNDVDKGQIHRNAMGRLVMQFRQWMPAHYNRRFQKRHYDSMLGDDVEGYYRTTGKFIFSLLRDLKNMDMAKMFSEYKNLSENDKYNIKRSMMEVGMFAALFGVVTFMLGPSKDKKTWWGRMLDYQIRRAYMETGASVPGPIFIRNIWSLLKSPAASINTFNNLCNLFCVWDLADEIESGRWKGHSLYYRNVMNSIPILGQIRKAYDLTDESYMFAMFNRNN